jgi:hypothetical protein
MPLTPEEQKELYKQAIKEGVNEWMDNMYKTVGKWTIHGGLVTIVGLLGYMYGYAHGWFQK